MSRVELSIRQLVRPADRVTAALKQSFISAVRTVTVEETDGGIVLRGNVRRYYDKQVAQHIAMDTLEGNQLQIDNQINVPKTARLTDF